MGRNLSLEEQRQVLLDLSQIGLADRKFLHSEATFIHHVSEVWSVHRAEGLDESWSILGQGGIQGEALHGLALLYLVVSIGPDGEISDAEREVISRQLFQWIPDADSEDIDSALRSALATFSLKSIGEITSEAVQSVRRLIPSHQFPLILSDLKAIACADHVMSVEERIWIQRLSKALEN